MKNIALTAIVALSSAVSLPAFSQSNAIDNVGISVQEQYYSDAELDSMLAPIALYPDTLLTHILIAATYPLDVVAADRWRQSNQHLTPEQVENVLETVTWDPSVKALTPFTDLIQTMAEDLDWLQRLGDNVLISQERVLERVQVLRQHAHNTGNLVTNDYVEVERSFQQDRNIIYIEPRQREVLYIPYYDPYIVYGHWWHTITPIFWRHRISYHHHHNVYWAPRIRLSASFYFGGVHWTNRHVVIHRERVRNYYYGSPRKRVVSKEYRRWEHRIDHRRARYSQKVVSSAPSRYARTAVIRNNEKYRTTTLKTSRGNTPSKHTSTQVASRYNDVNRKEKTREKANIQRPDREHALKTLKQNKRAQLSVSSQNRSVARTTDDRKRVQAKVEKTKPQQAARHDRMDKPQIRSTRPEKQVKRYSQQRADKPSIERQRVKTPERQRVKAPERQRAERSKVERKRVERVVKERSFSK